MNRATMFYALRLLAWSVFVVLAIRYLDGSEFWIIGITAWLHGMMAAMQGIWAERSDRRVDEEEYR